MQEVRTWAQNKQELSEPESCSGGERLSEVVVRLLQLDVFKQPRMTPGQEAAQMVPGLDDTLSHSDLISICTPAL